MSDKKFGKIKKIVKKEGIKPSDCVYHTNRNAKNKEGERTGKIRVLVPKKDGIARVEYVCPECGNYGFLKKKWERPFAFYCEDCEQRLTVPRMKDLVKRERKKAKKGK